VCGWLAGLRTGQALTHGALSLVPLYAGEKTAAAPRYLTLAAAIAAGAVTIAEAGTAQVPTLQVVNEGALPVLILDGEEVVGGRQNRVANSTLLVPPKCTFPLPVSCVEQGRWYQSSATFAPGEAAFPALRAAKAEHVAAGYASTGAPVANQAAVWREVFELHAREAVASPTQAMRDAYEQRQDALQQAERALPLPEDGPVGVAGVAQGHAFCADVFDHPATLRAYWSRLLRSYTLEAAGTAGKEGAPQAAAAGEAVAATHRLLERARSASAMVFPSPGLGYDVRLSGHKLVGASLVHGGAAIHTALFRRSPRESRGVAAGSSAGGWIDRPSRRARQFGDF
jgi:hypothetical protein